MDKRIVIGVAAVAGAVGLLYIMKRQTSQATNTAAANTSGSASSLLSGLLSGWAQPAATVPPPAVVAANGNASAAAPPSSLPFTVGGGGSTLQPKPVSMTPAPTPAPAPKPAPAPAPVAAPEPAVWGYEPTVKDLLSQLIPGYNVTDKDAHYWTNHGGVDAVKNAFGSKTFMGDFA